MTEGLATRREACPSAARSRSFGRAQRLVHVEVAVVRSLRKSSAPLSGKSNLKHTLRTVLQEALGIGTGTGVAPGDSWRGRVVRFSDSLRRDIGCAHGLIVTEPFYSSRRRYQLVVPVLDLRDFESSETDVLVEGKEWLPSIFGDFMTVAFATDLVQAVFHPTDVAASPATVIDEGTLARIDARLMQLFDLQEHARSRRPIHRKRPTCCQCGASILDGGSDPWLHRADGCHGLPGLRPVYDTVLAACAGIATDAREAFK